MDFFPRNIIACAACAKLKIKCDKKLPCSRCAARGVFCESRYLRRSANIETAKIAKNASNPRTQERRRQELQNGHSTRPENGSPLPKNGSTLPANGQLQEGDNDGLNRASEDSLNFDHDTLHHTLSDPSRGRTAEPSQSNGPSRPQASTVDFNPVLGRNMTPQAPRSTDESGPGLLNDIQSFSSGYMQHDMNFDMSLDEDNLFSPMFVNMLAQSSQPTACPSSTFRAPFLASPNSAGSPELPNTMTSSVEFTSDPKWHILEANSTSYGNIQEHWAILASRWHWRSFQSMSREGLKECPKTARVYLEGLIQALSNQDMQSSSKDASVLDGIDPKSKSSVLVAPFSDHTRDKLLVFTQALLHKALQVHRSQPGVRSQDTSSEFHHLSGGNEAFIILPSPKILESYIHIYMCRFEQSYPSIPAGELRTNGLMRISEPLPATLLLLLMVALGSMTSGGPETHYLASGLTEVCRIGLVEMAEKNVDSPWDICLLRSALLFTLLAAWNGDKWHMDIAVAQRGMNIAILRQSTLLKYQKFSPAIHEHRDSLEAFWDAWKVHESKIRLVYSWVTIDLEISMFHDVAPAFSMNELSTVLPQSDHLWQARTASEWSRLQEQAPQAVSTFSLSDLFGSFIRNGSPDQSLLLTPLHLRLLLYPIQTLVYNIRQFRTCFSSGSNRRTIARPSNRSRIDARLGEAQSLLLQWHNLHRLASEKGNSSSQSEPMATMNLILYHLVSLDAMVCFACIEQLRSTDLRRNSCGRQSHCIEDTEETWIHCGQVIRLLRRISDLSRPVWYAAAVYRVSLISYANSLLFNESVSPTPTTTHSHSSFSSLMTLVNESANSQIDKDNVCAFAIDTLLPEDHRLERYQKYGEGTPVLRRKSGELVATSDPSGVLTVCWELLDNSDHSPFAMGIRDRLIDVARRRTS